MSKQTLLNTNGIGERIRELRKNKGFSQMELANLIGCAQNTVAEWERRQGRGPGKKFIGRVAQVLGVSLDYLLGQEKLDSQDVIYYGEVLSKEFMWSEKYNSPENDTFGFSFRVMDNLLEPIVYKGDLCIFKKLVPHDGDIVVARFPDERDRATIKRWRQQKNKVMLCELNPYEINEPYFLDILEFCEEDMC